MWDRYARFRRIQALDSERDGREIRRLSGDDFYADYEQALRLALFRTYAVPSISALLEQTGEFTERGSKRYDDTALILYEIFKDGPDSERGLRAVRQLNRIHGKYEISNADYVYTLATFVVIPGRWIARYGWRRVSRSEIDASVAMYVRLGAMMGLCDVPQTYEAFERFLDAYEATHFRFTQANANVAAATLDVFLSRLPLPLRPLLGPVLPRLVSVMLEDRLREAVGFPRPPPALRKLVDAALRARARVLPYFPPARAGRSRVQPPAPTYPCGYSIEELGPAHAACPHSRGASSSLAPARDAE